MGESPRTRALLSAALILTVAILSACGPREDRSSGEVLVFSAASLQDVMSDIEDLYEAGGGPKVSFSFGGSQVLAQQIASGAPADVFISAGEAPMEFLNERALVGQPADVLSNSLVVAVRSGNTPDLKSFADLAGPAVSRLAIADPNLAPAGRYAREALQGLGSGSPWATGWSSDPTSGQPWRSWSLATRTRPSSTAPTSWAAAVGSSRWT